MMNKLFFVLGYVLLLALLGSCCGSLGDCNQRNPIIVKAIGFSQSELDTITVIKYPKNSGFVNAVSTKITRQLHQYTYYSTSSDTLFVQVDNDFLSDFDWVIKVKSTNNEIRLGSLVYIVGKETCQGVGARIAECSNNLCSVKINGRDTVFAHGNYPPSFLLKK